MELEVLKEFIEEKYGVSDFLEAVMNEDTADFEKATGMVCNRIDSFRGSEGDHDSYHFIFTLDDRFYEATGYYDSHNGVDDVEDFWEVKLVEKTIKVWEPIAISESEEDEDSELGDETHLL